MSRYGSKEGVFRLLGVDPTPRADSPAFSLFDPIGGIAGVEERLDSFSDWAESKAPGNAVPFEDPVPPQVTQIVQLRTAVDIVVSCGLANFDQLIERERVAIADYLSFASGAPIRSAGGARTNLAVLGSATSSASRTLP